MLMIASELVYSRGWEGASGQAWSRWRLNATLNGAVFERYRLNIYIYIYLFYYFIFILFDIVDEGDSNTMTPHLSPHVCRHGNRGTAALGWE